MDNTINCNLKDNKDKIKEAIREIVDPIANTISPRGGNVLFRSEQGVPIITNDGATISKVIRPKDELKRLIVDSIIQSAEHTNQVAGDATSTTILLNGAILDLYISKQEEGITHFEFIESLKKARDLIIEKLKEFKLGGEGLESNMDDIKRVAYVSANNDEELAEVTIDVITKAGDYGIIKYEANSSPETKVESEDGFIIKGAVVDKIFLNNETSLGYSKMAVFITESKIFYAEDMNVIFNAAIKSGVRDILIIANDFSAKIPNVLRAAQSNKEYRLKVLPIAISSKDVIHDIAAYLSTKVYAESLGKIREDIIDDYIGRTGEVGGNMSAVAIKHVYDSKEKEDRISFIKSLLEKDKSNQEYKSRLASMTTGVVTLKVGGSTDLERTEKMLRFEDAIKASQSAMYHGYLPGAGSSLLRVLSDVGFTNKLTSVILNTICSANYTQILNNCGIDEPLVEVEADYVSLNANTGEFEDMVEAGIYDSYLAVEQSLLNAVSTSIGLISAMSNTIIINNNK